MNLRTLLLAPWRATYASLRWVALSVVALCLTVSVIVVLVTSKPDKLWIFVGPFGGALFFVWAFFLSGITLLAVDGRWLRIPSMQRTAAWSLMLYAVLSVLPATLVGGLFGGDMADIGLMLALCVLGGLTFSLMPRYIAIVFGLLPATYNHFGAALHLPGPGDARFVSWAGTLSVALIMLCMARWRMVLSYEPQKQFGMSGPMVLQFRRNNWAGAEQANAMDGTYQARQRPDWMQPQPDLRKAGPQQPGTAMRVALGGWYLPKTLMGHVQSLGPTLMATAVPVLVMFLSISGKQGLPTAFWWSFAAMIIAWVGMFGSMGAAIMTVMLMMQRWRKTNAELPLLALLPGIGDAESAKRQMLRTALQRPLMVVTASLLVILLITVTSHPTSTAVLLLVVAQLGSAATLVACVLSVLGGKPLPGWAIATIWIVISVLLGSMSFVPTSMMGKHPWTPAFWFMVPIMAGWIIVGLVMAWIGRRGWLALRAQPHVFMPNV